MKLLLEIMIVILGYNKHIIFTFLLIFSLLLNSACSLFITAMGNDLNTRKAEYVLVLGYQLDNNNITDTLKYRLDKAYKYAKANEKTGFAETGTEVFYSNMEPVLECRENFASGEIDKFTIC